MFHMFKTFILNFSFRNKKVFCQVVYTVGAVYITWQQYQYQYQVVYTVGAVAAAYELYSSLTQVLVLEKKYQYL